ncbi:MAG: hypothetical protein AAF614_03030 [Chloroflexota bacterium]
MAVNHHPTPDQAHETLQTTLPELLQTEAVRSHLFQDQVGELDYRHPFPVYSIGENGLENGRFLDNMQPIGWRHLLFDGDNAVASIDLNADGTEVVKITQGKFVQLALAGLEAAQRLEETTHTDYMVSYIEIYGLYFAALWLQSEDAEAIIIPLEEQDDGDVQAMRPYAEADILALLRQKPSFTRLEP